MSDFYKKVAKIQATLKAPKSQYNKFGNYAYRNAEDIMEAVKPLLGELVLTINDQLEYTPAGVTYIRSTATITDGTHSISNSALAREATDSKGMSAPQMTGSTSSYARKYALNGLFLIDDTKDDDATNKHGKEDKAEKVEQQPVKQEVAKPAAGATAAEAPKVKPSFKRPVLNKPAAAAVSEDL